MKTFPEPTPEKLARDKRMAEELIALNIRMGGDDPEQRPQVFVDIAIAVLTGIRVCMSRAQADELFADIVQTAHESAEMHEEPVTQKVH